MPDHRIVLMHLQYGRSSAHTCSQCVNYLPDAYGEHRYNKCKAYGMTRSHETDWKGDYSACGHFGILFGQEVLIEA